jgi:hypothetical protein
MAFVNVIFDAILVFRDHCQNMPALFYGVLAILLQDLTRQF